MVGDAGAAIAPCLGPMTGRDRALGGRGRGLPGPAV